MSEEWYQEEVRELIKLTKSLKLDSDQIVDLFSELNDLFRAIRNECSPLEMIQLMAKRDRSIYKLLRDSKHTQL